MTDPRPLPAPGAPRPTPPLRKVAIEEHFKGPAVPDEPDYATAAAASGVVPEFMQAAYKRLRDLTTVRLEEMDAAGIDIAVLSLMAPGIEMISERHVAIMEARRVNDFLAETVRASGGRYAGFASVPLQDTDAAIAELDRAVNDLGFPAVMVNGFVDIGSGGQPHYLDEERFDAFWEATASLGVPVYLHPRPSVQQVRDSWYTGHPELAGATWGFAPETATHTLRLVYGGVFDRHPDATLIIGHMGEMLPFFAWRIQRAFEYNPFEWRPAKRLQDYLADNIYITTSGNFSSQALITAILTVGADRILFATDYPFEVSTDGARWIETAPISESDRRKIVRSNAIRLFGLPDKPL